jgi:hypothetical protein
MIRKQASAWYFVAVTVLIAVLAVLRIRSGDQSVAEAREPPAASPATTEGDVDDASLQGLWYAVVNLRNECAVNGESGWDAFLAPQACEKLDELNRLVWEEQSDLGWSYFFARSLFEIGRPTSDAPLVGFYHPWSDAWLITEWQVKPEPKIKSMELLCGEWVRRRGESPMDLRPDWLRRDGFRAEQLARAVVDNMQAFERLALEELPWREALRLDEQQEVLDEINTPAVSVQLLSAYLRAMELTLGEKAFDDERPMPPVLGQLVRSCDRFLTAGSEGNGAFFVELAASTSPAAAELIGSMPPEAYEQFAPAFWLADDDWAQAYLVPDQNPDSCLVLTYNRVEDRLQLTRLDLVHYPSIAAARKQVDD